MESKMELKEKTHTRLELGQSRLSKKNSYRPIRRGVKTIWLQRSTHVTESLPKRKAFQL